MTPAVAAVILLLVLTSALLSAAEAATFSLGDPSLRTLLDEGFAGAPELRRVRSRSGPVQAAVHLVVSALNLTAVGLIVMVAATTGSGIGVLGALFGGVVTVVFGTEIAPRALAARHPVRLALKSAPVLLRVERWIRVVVSPILRMEVFLSGRDGEEEVTDAEREALEVSALGQQEGMVDPDEHLLVERAFRLDELSAWNVMTPRVDIFAWKDDLQLRDIIEELKTVPYSRVPVYGESIDDVTGILYVREAYESFVAGQKDVSLTRISREPFFVPGSLSLARLLRDFQARRIHMGIVADEFGGTDGLVTLEDVLEELVGEIVDETDVEDEALQRIARNELVAEGNVDLREINYAFNVSLPQLEHRSLNGFLLEEMGYVPETGETVERAGVEIEVLEATDTQVLRARLRRTTAPASEPRTED